MRLIIATFLCLCAVRAVPLADDKTTNEKPDSNVVQASTETVTPEEVTYTLIASSSSKVPSNKNVNTVNGVTTLATPGVVTSAGPETTTKITRTRGTRPSRVTTSRTPTSRTTKTSRRKTSTSRATEVHTTAEAKTSQTEIPMTRQEWLKLIENEMVSYEKQKGSSPISNKNLTMISTRILKFLIENGTTVGIDLKENKAKNVITLQKNNKNLTMVDKVYGDGTESKFPPILEYIVQRIQSSFSIYKYQDESRLPTTEENATLRETPDDEDDDDDEDSKETSTSSNNEEEVFSQLEEELSEYLSPNGNGTAIKLPTIIKTAYDKFTSWLIPGKPNAKEEPVEEEGEEEVETEVAADENKKKPSIIKTAYDAIETLWSIFDESEGDDDEEKSDAAEATVEQKESPDDESGEDKDSVSENILDFLNLAYSLYEAS